MTTREIATVLKASPSTIRQWLRNGILIVRGPSRLLFDLDEFLRGGRA